MPKANTVYAQGEYSINAKHPSREGGRIKSFTGIRAFFTHKFIWRDNFFWLFCVVDLSKPGEAPKGEKKDGQSWAKLHIYQFAQTEILSNSAFQRKIYTMIKLE